MKKISALFLLFLNAGFAFAQNCSPDPQYFPEGPGVYPDSLVGLPPAFTCQPYSAVITVIVPYDTVVDFGSGPDTTIIDSVVLKTVDDLPPGFSHACEPPSCSFPGGTAGCIVITGFPDQADTGEYVPVGNVFGYVDAFPGFGLVFPKIDYYIIDINPGGGSVNAAISNSLPISCSGSCDGALTVSASCGFPPYTYSWSNGSDSATATGLCAGNYSVTVSDSSGSVVVNYVLAQPGPLALNFSQSDPANGCNGSATVYPSGGTPPYSYSWSTGDTAQTISSLCSGFYQVTVTDAGGCPPAVNAVFLMVGTDEFSDNGRMSLWVSPNPNNGKFSVRIVNSNNGLPGKLKIYNLLGEQVFFSAFEKVREELIDLSFLPEGHYFFQWVTSKEVFNKKIIIVK